MMTTGHTKGTLWLTWGALPLLGGLLGAGIGSAGGGLLGVVGGLIYGWAVRKGAVLAAIRGGILGIVFALLIGPGGDWLISGTPFGEKVVVALVVGFLVGSLLGVRNFRAKKPSPAVNADTGDQESSAS